MKNPLGYLLLIFTALMLLSVVGGISQWFTTVSNTWTVEQTDILARDFSQVLWYGGIVFVSVIGWYLYSLAPKPISRPQSRPAQPQYMIADGLAGVPSFNDVKALPEPAETVDWYEIEAQSEVCREIE